MRCPFATWRGTVPNRTTGGEGPTMGLVLHHQQGTEAGTDSWFHNPRALASAHFGAPRAGGLDQWVDTADAAWAEAAGNPRWLSLELEGYATEAMTAAQVAWAGRLYSWGAAQFGWPNLVTDNMNHGGLAWHGMGGAAWGGHYDCPGPLTVAQRPAVLRLAFPLVPPAAHLEVSMAMPRSIPDPKAPADPKGRVAHWDIDAAGNVYCWDGARQLTSLGKLTATHPPIADAFAHPSGDGVVLVGADGRLDGDEWAESTYTILVGM